MLRRMMMIARPLGTIAPLLRIAVREGPAAGNSLNAPAKERSATAETMTRTWASAGEPQPTTAPTSAKTSATYGIFRNAATTANATATQPAIFETVIGTPLQTCFVV